MRKINKKKSNKFKKILIAFVAISPLLVVFSQAYLTKTNIELERRKNDLNKQIKKNESLKMKIDELASLKKLKEIALSSGLEYNNNNVIKLNARSEDR